MVSVSLNTAVVAPKAEVPKVDMEPLASKKGDYVKTPVSAREFQDYLMASRPQKDEVIISEAAPIEFTAVTVEKTRKQQREDSSNEVNVQLASTLPNPAAVAPAQLDLVSEPDPVSTDVPKVSGSEDKQPRNPTSHTASHNDAKDDSLELSEQGRKEAAKEVQEPVAQQPPSTDDIDPADHFNELF